MRLDELRSGLDGAARRQPAPDIDAGRRAVRGRVRRRRWGAAAAGVGLVAVAAVGVTVTDGNDDTQQVRAVDGGHDPMTSRTPATSPTTAVTVEELRAFRDQAADTPWWWSVDWAAPRTLDQAIQGDEGVAWARIDEAGSSGVRPDPAFEGIDPYEDTPTVQRVDVIVEVLVDGEGPRIVRLPVDSGVGAMEVAVPLAEEIAAATPTGVRAVVALDDGGGATIVALQADDGTLVAFYESMDPVVAPFDGDELVDALRAQLG